MELIKSLFGPDFDIPEPIFKSVLTSEMNLREWGSLKSLISGTIPKGIKVTIVDEIAGYDACHSWIKIIQENGPSGWVCGIVQGRTKYQLLNKI